MSKLDTAISRLTHGYTNQLKGMKCSDNRGLVGIGVAGAY